MDAITALEVLTPDQLKTYCEEHDLDYVMMGILQRNLPVIYRKAVEDYIGANTEGN